MLDTIYTYGNGQYAYEVLKAIALIGSSDYGSIIIKSTSMIGLLYGVIGSLISGRNIFSTQGQFIAKYIIVTSILLVPSSKIIVRDEVSGYQRDVESVPFGLALPAVIFNNIGYGVTMLFDTAFQSLDDDITPYYKYGMVFGSNLVAESRNLRIHDPLFYDNMYAFSKKCFIRTAAIAPGLYRDANNLWEVMMTKGPKLLSVEYTYPKGHQKAGQREILNCRAAAHEMDKYWGDEAKYAVQKRLAKVLGSHRGDLKNLGNSLDNYYTKYQEGISKAIPGDSGKSALDLVRQQMIINSSKDVAYNYMKSRGLLEQNAVWVATGEMAKEILPIFRGVCEVLVYSCFLLMLFTVMLPGGWRAFIKYMQVLLWLQLWGPLYSVLNFVMQISSHITSTNIGSIGYSYGTHLDLVSHHQQVAGIAGMLSMSIPVIAKWIVDYSGESFMQMAGNFVSSAGGVASSIASEVVRGNTALDNVSIGNTQIGNTSAMQHNMSPNYEFGVNSIRMSDGSLFKSTGDGSQMTISGAGITHSVGANNISLARGISSNVQRGLTDSRQDVESWNRNVSQAEESAQNVMAQYVENFAERTSKGESFDFSKSGSEGRMLQDAMNYAEVLHDDYGYNKDQAAKMGVDISLKGGMSKVLGLVPGLNKIIDINPHAGVDVSSSNRQTLGERNENMYQENYHKNLESTLRAMSSENFAQHNNLDKSFTQDIGDSYRMVKASHEALNKAQDRMHRYEEARSWAESASIHSDYNLYHTAQSWMVESGIVSNLHEASKILDDPFSEDYRRVSRDFTEALIRDDNLLSSARGLDASQVSISNLEYARNTTFNDDNFKIEKDTYPKVRERVLESGLDLDDQKFVDGNGIKNKVEDLNRKSEISSYIREVRNENMFNDKQKEVDTEEKARTTRSVFGRDKKVD